MKTHYLTSLPEDWLPVAAVFAALGDATRQKILLLFEPGEEISIKDIAGRFTLSRTSVVHHLAVLEKAGLLAVRRSGKMALYSVRHEPVLEALQALQRYIEEDLAEYAAKRAAKEGSR